MTLEFYVVLLPNVFLTDNRQPTTDN